MEDRYALEANTHPHNDTLAAFMHWTYFKSDRSFIIADLQGYKCCVPLSVTSDDMDVIKSSMIDIGEMETTRGEKVIKWILSDPAVHMLKGGGGDDGLASEINDCLAYDFDGNLGMQAEAYFFERHVCNDICALLRLPKIC
jgi:hypothetical protein